MQNPIRRFMFVYLDQDTPGHASLRGKPDRGIRRRPQLGFQYLMATLARDGIESSILDQTITPFGVEELVAEIKATGADIIGFYTATTLKDKVNFFISALKKKIDVPIIVGGPGSVHGHEYLKAGCDIVCNGEGERTIINIIGYYNGAKEKSGIKGISYLESGNVVINPPEDLIENLDMIPYPKRDKSMLRYYHDYYIFTMRKPYVTMTTSRGCPMQCTFCTSHLIWKKKYRVRSVDNVIGEIDELKNEFGVRYIAFLDDIFGFNNTWLKEFCNKMIAKNYGIRWMCIVHPFSFMKSREEDLELMKKAGCDTLSFGLQSAHPDILKNIKRMPQESIELEKTIALAKKKGFLTSLGIIFGLPGETPETIRYTIDYCCRIRPTYVEFYNLDILEGSEIESRYKVKENVCPISKDDLDGWCRYAARKFYGHPKQAMEMLSAVAKNPSWLFILAKHSGHFIKNIGF